MHTLRVYDEQDDQPESKVVLPRWLTAGVFGTWECQSD